MKHHFSYLTLAATITISLLAGMPLSAHAALSNRFRQSTTATVFFHGYGSGAHAERHMVNAAVNAGVTKTVVSANVDANGHVTFSKKIPRHAINPIVMVNFEDNENTNYSQDGQYVASVLHHLKTVDHIKNVNLEAHSMGNMALAYYFLKNAHNKQMPRVRKQLDLAAPMNGIQGYDLPVNFTVNQQTGKPSAMSANYRQMTQLRHLYPKNQVKILNIYGDVGNRTDNQVDVRSAQSLRYLESSRAKSFREKKITGPGADHVQLHRNPEVDQLLIQFFWGK
ncbi:MAG: alpha/beta hydrolase [[Lactobacillus] timonensis]|jgi:uncharacterized alpha/beta hydrolase family protein|uniref:alpha/beta hydrolase n=1 Tax=[Lactobacillus] timonensis TaxID=1970790 RepID=UPI0023557DF9|nr:alpha/beta hydrolase [[Lactobacillus] timonensis]MCI1926383.1 alpha/beta hydrolase [[Lactobacillus] timonensis]MCI1957744.1 alpha/beta hydrolase [[Lactobacillus] timonensis]MCI1970762.1 alpha/beta hydrolase [[Lactobacillus] timonensis]MCI2006908.1 alpha/beta hydrolase [[Lactobacillus] timonensis]